MHVKDIDLKQAVSALRAELLEAVAENDDTALSFAVESIDMEFSVELRVDARAHTGIKAWVVSADVGTGVGRNSSHKVKVSLKPVWHGHGDKYISDEERYGR